MPVLTYAAVTFGGNYTATSASVRRMKDQIDVTNLTDSRRQYQDSPLFSPGEATLEFLGYGPRAGATGTLSVAGASIGVATVVSSSVTFALNEPIRSQATFQYRQTS